MTTRTVTITKVFPLLLALGFCQITPLDAEAGFFRKRAARKAAAAAEKQQERDQEKWQKKQSKLSDKESFVQEVRRRAEGLSQKGFPYIFGGSSPADGGMDCSGTMKYLLAGLIRDIPRTSYHQYEWIKKNRTMRHTKTIPAKMGGRRGLNPGNLIFWGGTYNSGHKVSHVMIYLGQAPDGKHYMFGARGKKKKGLNGSGVDIFELRAGKSKSLIGFGSIPGSE